MLLLSGFLALSAKYLLLLKNSHLRSRCLPRGQASNRLNQPVTWAPRPSSYKRETTPKPPSSEQGCATNRNSSSSTSLGPTEMCSRGNQRICQECQGVDRACIKSRPQSHTKEAMTKTFLPGQARSHQERAGETTRSRVH